MRFNQLSEKDTNYINEVYTGPATRAEADRQLSEHFNVSERTIRNWARTLGLTGSSESSMEEVIVTTPKVRYIPQPFTYEQNGDPIFYEKGKSRVLVVGDIHSPFDLDEYINHCKKVYAEFQCNKVVFIGDVIDSHYSSFHQADPNGMGGGDELDYAIERLRRYYEAFPYAISILGNHCRIVQRKAFAGGIPKQWIKEFAEVLEVPTWDFVIEKEIDGVLYIHGEGGTAKSKYKTEEQSVVQGHLHTQCYVEWAFSKNSRKFAMQVGTGIDFDSYAFAYAKAGKKPAISCGVVLNGAQAFVIPMEL
jgi:predicted phosphodiesterase